MQRVAGQIHRERSLVNVEPVVAPLDEAFRLQNEAELCSAEAPYLPASASDDGASTDRGVSAPDLSLMPRSVPTVVLFPIV